MQGMGANMKLRLQHIFDDAKPQRGGIEALMAMKKTYPMDEPQPNRRHIVHTIDDAFPAMFLGGNMVRECGAKVALEDCTAIMYDPKHDCTWLQATWQNTFQDHRDLSAKISFEKDLETLIYKNVITHLMYNHYLSIIGRVETQYILKRAELDIKGDG